MILIKILKYLNKNVPTFTKLIKKRYKVVITEQNLMFLFRTGFKVFEFNANDNDLTLNVS